jgi:hypothetical protein
MVIKDVTWDQHHGPGSTGIRTKRCVSAFSIFPPQGVAVHSESHPQNDEV